MVLMIWVVARLADEKAVDKKKPIVTQNIMAKSGCSAKRPPLMPAGAGIAK